MTKVPRGLDSSDSLDSGLGSRMAPLLGLPRHLSTGFEITPGGTTSGRGWVQGGLRPAGSFALDDELALLIPGDTRATTRPSVGFSGAFGLVPSLQRRPRNARARKRALVKSRWSLRWPHAKPVALFDENPPRREAQLPGCTHTTDAKQSPRPTDRPDPTCSSETAPCPEAHASGA